jgi:hypothetical protein
VSESEFPYKVPGNEPAFPYQFDPRFVVHPGMTLRDWFAGQALAGYIACPAMDALTRTEIVGFCYEFADLMLKARREEAT